MTRSTGASPAQDCARPAATSTCAKRGRTPATTISTSTCRPAARGDVYDRTLVREQEIRESLRIVEQCLNNMPAGPYKADHPLTCPPPKERTLKDIDTLITHFLGVSWGPVMPAGETSQMIEATKGITRLLPDERWQHDELPDADPHAELRPPAADPERDPRANGAGPGRVHRIDRLCHVGRRPMSEPSNRIAAIELAAVRTERIRTRTKSNTRSATTPIRARPASRRSKSCSAIAAGSRTAPSRQSPR